MSAAARLRAEVRRRWVGPVADVAVPAVLLVVGLAELTGMSGTGRGWAALLEVLASVILVWRRRWPLLVPVAAYGALMVMPLVGPNLEDAAAPILYLAVATYSLARWRRDLLGLLGVAGILLMLLGTYLWSDDRSHDITDVVFVLSLVTPPYVVGRIVRRLDDRGRLLLANQELVRQAAVRDERDRIARELHDVIAHTVSAMVVQTAVAQDLVRSDPAAAERVLADVAETGRRALGETGRLLHVIRDPGEELALAPAPGLAAVPQLVERFRADGLRVDLRLDQAIPVLPAGVDVSAYRIVQEALTNALRYSADRSASLSVSATTDGLRIRARNRSDGPTSKGSGLGLLGMRERVTLLGGTLAHGDAEPGVFEVDAVLPVSP